MIIFRQLIKPGDVGADIWAVKRAMRVMGVSDATKLKATYKAGDQFVACIREVERAHGLKADGIYGPKCHAIIAPHFDGYGRLLYRMAARRSTSGYVNPFRNSWDLEPGRTDMGVDYHGKGPIVALGDCELVGLGGRGWPGGAYMLFKLTAGKHAGRYWYVAEAVEGSLAVPFHMHLRAKLGWFRQIKAGTRVAIFKWNAAPGFFPGIETGWSSATVNLTWAAVTTGYKEGEQTAAGRAFARLLKSVGCPVREDPGPGPTFPI